MDIYKLLTLCVINIVICKTKNTHYSPGIYKLDNKTQHQLIQVKTGPKMMKNCLICY